VLFFLCRILRDNNGSAQRNVQKLDGNFMVTVLVLRVPADHGHTAKVYDQHWNK
jgi:hypothetical protein